MWGILIAIASGALMSIQGVWNTQLSRAGSTCQGNHFYYFHTTIYIVSY